jgi:purine-nucleoside phosphorylase
MEDKQLDAMELYFAIRELAERGADNCSQASIEIIQRFKRHYSEGIKDKNGNVISSLVFYYP